MGSTYRRAGFSISTLNKKKQINKRWACGAECREADTGRCQETGNLLRDWRFGHAWWKNREANAIEKLILSLSLHGCLSVLACLGASSMQISVLWSTTGTEFIPVPFHQGWLNTIRSQNISPVIDSARWRSPRNKCVVREIHLATFDVIMLEHCHWRKAQSQSKSWGSCLGFCRAQWAKRCSHRAKFITAIPNAANHTKNLHTCGPFRCFEFKWLKMVDYFLSHNIVKLCLLSFVCGFKTFSPLVNRENIYMRIGVLNGAGLIWSLTAS